GRGPRRPPPMQRCAGKAGARSGETSVSAQDRLGNLRPADGRGRATVRRRLAWGVAALAGLAALVPLFLVGLAAKERDNNFCVSCHLHGEKFQRFTSVP